MDRHATALRSALTGGLCLLLTAYVALGQTNTTTVSFISGDHSILDQNNNPLTAGPVGDGNGAVLQLGYYSGGSTTNNFLGTWVALSGETSLNTAIIAGSAPPEQYNQTSIGDLSVNFADTATFALQLSFRQGDPTSGNSLPASTTIPLALRFYNDTTIASSTHYNVVSDDDWLWKSPSFPPNTINISLNDVGLEWLSTAMGQSVANEFHTSIPLAAVPETSTVVCAAFVAVGLALHASRRRWFA